jgi:hypothetical protein
MYYNGLGLNFTSRSRDNRDFSLLLALSPDEC